jgi:EAL domain-containing protein (putative c-di-GMP-specific phosphodiesterase class I)
VVKSLSRIAEDLVRSAKDSSLHWQGYTLSSHFQPIYSVREAGCVGFEALIRINDGQGNPQRPDKLFAQAFEEGDGVLLDWICRALHLRRFATLDSGDRTLFVNIHPEAAVREGRSAREFDDLIRFYGLTAERVCIEILEGHCADEGMLKEAVACYRSLGATIAMDDFGIGRSNFDRIVALRPDVVKIDRSVLTAAVGDVKARRVLPSIIELLHEAGAEVAIEGIESGNEALLAMDSGADLLQGFHFAAPTAGIPDDSLTRRILAELIRMRGVKLTAVPAA